MAKWYIIYTSTFKGVPIKPRKNGELTPPRNHLAPLWRFWYTKNYTTSSPLRAPLTFTMVRSTAPEERWATKPGVFSTMGRWVGVENSLTNQVGSEIHGGLSHTLHWKKYEWYQSKIGNHFPQRWPGRPTSKMFLKKPFGFNHHGFKFT